MYGMREECTVSATTLYSSVNAPTHTPFDCTCHRYLVVSLSDWCDVFQSPKETIRLRRARYMPSNYFSRFGIPEELSSDGGPEFASATTQEFLTRWGVHHRLSSAY